MSNSYNIRIASFSIIHGLLIFGSTLIFIILIITSCSVFYGSVVKEKDININRSSEFYKDENIEDNKNEFLVEKDTLNYLYERFKLLERHNEIVLSDLRQESNNIINKVNGWLGFWIAVLAILGGFIPLIAQYISSKKNKIEIEKIFKDIDIKIMSTELNLFVSSLMFNFDNAVTLNNEKRNKLIIFLKKDIYNTFDKIVNQIDKNKHSLSHNEKILLLNSLIQYSRLFDLYMFINLKKDRKSVAKIRDLIKEIVNDLLTINKDKDAYHILWKKLEELQILVANISIEE
ncbi:MAG: hypothetical protein J1E16_11795 [Muribaculaceae bacterium]|nr:hypothetical protein [Muribaculaceae bacterium]